jgi:hypothetical protein
VRAWGKLNVPLYAYYMMKNHSKLFKGALAVFGSWNKAIIAAGITVIPRKVRVCLLRELRDAMESGSSISQALRSEIGYYFGSLRKAQAALETDRKLLSGWSKRKIIAVLTDASFKRETELRKCGT